jgi:hypothetical protein
MRIDIKMLPKLENFKRKAEEKPKPTDPESYSVEYSSSSEDFCTFCNEIILRNEIRIKKVVYDSKVGVEFGREILWHHLHCFVMQKEAYAIRFGGDELPGFEDLKEDHQKFFLECLPSVFADNFLFLFKIK